MPKNSGASAYLHEDITSVDIWDVLAVLAVFMGAGAMTGFADIVIHTFNLSDVFYETAGGTVISYGAFAALGGYISAALTNRLQDNDMSDFSQFEIVALVGGVAGVTLFIVAPDIANVFTGSAVRSGGFTILATIGSLVLASE